MNINIATSHPSAFISSTFLDLRNERKVVARILADSKISVNAIDVKPASTVSSKKEIVTGIKESDFVILLVGERYGSIIPQMTLNSAWSITRWEYEMARRNNKDILVYFKMVQSDDAVNYDDRSEVDFKKKCGLLTKFKNDLSSRHNPKYFSTPEELAQEIRHALIPTYRAGVKRLLEKQKNLLTEIDTIKNTQRLQETSKSIPTSNELMPRNALSLLVMRGALVDHGNALADGMRGPLGPRNALVDALGIKGGIPDKDEK